MKKYSYVDITTLDIDWFGVDSDGQVGHFASACSPSMPRVVAEGRQWNERLLEFFEGLARIKGAHVGPDPWDKFLERPVEKYREKYLDAVTEWADRGFYSFDYRSRKGVYLLVSSPSKPLQLSDQPDWVQDRVGAVTFSSPFREMEFVDIPQLPDRDT